MGDQERAVQALQQAVQTLEAEGKRAPGEALAAAPADVGKWVKWVLCILKPVLAFVEGGCKPADIPALLAGLVTCGMPPV